MKRILYLHAGAEMYGRQGIVRARKGLDKMNLSLI